LFKEDFVFLTIFDDSYDNFILTVPLDETNKQFYNKIYTGQKVSFGKMHKEYQG